MAAQIKPGALYAVDLPKSAPKTVALTIDDGPSEDTLEILKVLDRYEAKATFFSISENISGREAAIAQTIASGHELGNHLTADEPSIRLSKSEFAIAIESAEAVLTTYTSKNHLKWLRPGMGFYSSEMVEIANHHGYQLALGSVFPYDTHLPSAQFASAFILYTVTPGDIIVLHDGKKGRSQRTIATLEKVLPILQEKGYRVTTLSQLVETSKTN